MTFRRDEIRKRISIIIEVYITSLNPHFSKFYLVQDIVGFQHGKRRGRFLERL